MQSTRPPEAVAVIANHHRRAVAVVHPQRVEEIRAAATARIQAAREAALEDRARVALAARVHAARGEARNDLVGTRFRAEEPLIDGAEQVRPERALREAEALRALLGERFCRFRRAGPAERSYLGVAFHLCVTFVCAAVGYDPRPSLTWPSFFETEECRTWHRIAMGMQASPVPRLKKHSATNTTTLPSSRFNWFKVF